MSTHHETMAFWFVSLSTLLRVPLAFPPALGLSQDAVLFICLANMPNVLFFMAFPLQRDVNSNFEVGPKLFVVNL